jgi:hypothetical protein
LALAAHRLMSSATVPWWAVAGALSVVFGLARASAGEQRGLGPITALMLAVQAGLHWWFDAAQLAGTPARACVPMVGMDAMTGICGAPGAQSLSAVLQATPFMLVAHVAAAVLTAWWLWRGEAALFALVRLLRVRLADWTWLLWAWCTAQRRCARLRPESAPVSAGVRRSCRLLVLRFHVVRRGPPTRAALV